MLKIDIPGRSNLCLRALVTDYNGTLACDGILIPELLPLIRALAAELEIHVVTADTFGLAAVNLGPLPVKLTILPPGRQDRAKAACVRRLGARSTVCLGNGRNDRLMLKAAALGICVMGAEGTSGQTLEAADIVCRSAVEALNLLLHPKRLVATLRI